MSEEEKRAEEDEESVQRKIDEALACTCVSDLKEGPCGEPFVEAFSCFIRSQDIQVRLGLSGRRRTAGGTKSDTAIDSCARSRPNRTRTARQDSPSSR